ncbi:Ribosome biogenesis protein WDR12 -like protein [Sarcoptes scabiei]|uniref:Ribosome biogenesis protein WDR12 homolog n=2 Tax=Sarcoptes scabiei TaxID=52283 RepID=A0A834VBR0_SARSC|nr:Ribosome biogenesis protein WDR12 -like protein [Sarcoptes scabiei]
MDNPKDINSRPKEIIAIFFTNDEKYAVPGTPIALQTSFDSDNLNDTIKTLLKSTDIEINLDSIDFEFLINQKLLLVSLEEFLEKENLNAEAQINIQYFVKRDSPKPHKAFLLDDWISSIDTIDDWAVIGCYDSTAHICDLRNGEHKIIIPAHSSSIKAVSWLPKKTSNGFSFVTCAHDETSMLWDWNCETNQIDHIATFIGHARSVDCVDVHQDMIATGSYDHHLKIWSAINSPNIASDPSKSPTSKLRSPIITLEGHKEAITGCVWMRDRSNSSVATVSIDSNLKIWDVEIGESVQSFSSTKAFLDIAYCSRKGLFLTSSCDHFVRLWDPRETQGPLVKQSFNNSYSNNAWISCVKWSPNDDNLFVTGSYDFKVNLWDMRSSTTPLYELLGHQDKIMDVCWSTKNFIVSGGADCHLKIFKT